MSQIRTLLQRTQAHAADFLEGLDERPVSATSDAATLRARLGLILDDAGVPAEQVIDELVAATLGGHLGSAGGRFFAWVIGGALPSALAADWLASTWDNNAALHACGPARSEEHTSELQSLMRISYAVFCLKKKTNKKI